MSGEGIPPSVEIMLSLESVLGIREYTDERRMPRLRFLVLSPGSTAILGLVAAFETVYGAPFGAPGC